MLGTTCSLLAHCLLTVTSQMVQVVSMLDVPTVDGSASHQSNDVKGEQYSAFVFCQSRISPVSPSPRERSETFQPFQPFQVSRLRATERDAEIRIEKLQECYYRHYTKCNTKLLQIECFPRESGKQR